MPFEIVLYVPPAALTLFFARGQPRTGSWSFPGWVALASFLTGTITVWWMVVHAAFALGARLAGEESAKTLTNPDLVIGTFKYDFRLYAMMLMAVVIGWHGLQLRRTAPALRLGEREAYAQARRLSWRLLWLSLPLLPIRNANGGGYFVVLVTANLALLLWAALESRMGRVVPGTGTG